MREYTTLVCTNCGKHRVFRPRPKEWRGEDNTTRMFCCMCKKETYFKEVDHYKWGSKDEQ